MPSNCTVYVGNISSRVREKDMRRKFEKYGKIRRFELLRDFAFIDYEDPDDARDAIENLDGYDMEGRALQVALARSQNGGGGGGGGGYRGRSPDRDRGRPRMGHEIGSGIRGGAVRGRRDNCVLVKNLSSKIGWQDLKDWARQCGSVEYADIWTDRGKKYGVIKFDSHKDLSYAVEKLDDQYLDGRRVRVMEDTGQWQASVSRSRSPSSGSRSRSRSRSKSKKSKKEKESKENRSRSRSRSESSDRSSKRKKRGDDDSDDEGRKKKDKKKKKDRSNSPESSSSSSSSSSSAVDDQLNQ